jgi:hypothetical protein
LTWPAIYTESKRLDFSMAGFIPVDARAWPADKAVHEVGWRLTLVNAE